VKLGMIVTALFALGSLTAHASTPTGAIEGCVKKGLKDAKRVAVETFVDRLLAGDAAAAMSVLDPNIVLFAHDEAGALGGAYKAPAGVGEFYSKHMTQTGPQ
jgi:hypothetical protein